MRSKRNAESLVEKYSRLIVEADEYFVAAERQAAFIRTKMRGTADAE